MDGDTVERHTTADSLLTESQTKNITSEDSSNTPETTEPLMEDRGTRVHHRGNVFGDNDVFETLADGNLDVVDGPMLKRENSDARETNTEADGSKVASQCIQNDVIAEELQEPNG